MKSPSPYSSFLLCAPAARFCLALLCTLAGFAPLSRAATGVMNGLAEDAQVTQLAGVNAVSGQTSAYLSVGRYWGGTQLGAVYVFQIPASVLSDPAQRFTAATFTIKTGANNPTAFNGDLYGLGYTATPAVLADDFYQGPLAPSGVLVQDNFLTPSIAANATVSTSGLGLVDYLNGELEAARAASATAAYVYLRVSADTLPPPGGYYVLGMREAGGSAIPAISYTAETVSGWKTVPLGGGGAILGVVGAKTVAGAEIVYCRTDVGGAFRWNESVRGWNCITDKIIDPSVADGNNLNGINGLAPDPANPNRVYVAAGLYSTATPSGIYKTDDASAASPVWTAINTDVRCSANREGKLFGERLVVDPNDSNILYYGTNTPAAGPVGLIKGVNSGGTWTWTQLSALPNGTAGNGVTFVACDKNGTSTIVYAGVYGSGVYRSLDGGTTWTLLSGGPANPARGAVSPVDGTLFVTGNGNSVYSAARTASAMTATVISGAQTLVAVAADPSSAGVAMVTDYKNGDEVWRTTTGGSSWNLVSVTRHATDYDNSGPATFTSGDAFLANGSLLIGPSNSDQVWVGGLQGVMRTRNITTSPSDWYPLQKGQEEVVVMDMATTPVAGDAELMTGVADNNGFYYSNTSVRPDFRFNNPLPGNTPSLDFSEGNPASWARTWVNSDAYSGGGAVSHDSGATWLVFGQAARAVLAPGQAAGWDTWDLSAYLSQNAGKVVTLVLIPISTPSNTSTLSYNSREAAANTPELIVDGTTLSAAADTYVDGTPSGTPVKNVTNYGTETSLKTSYAWGQVANSKWIYLKFDLTGVSSVTNAALRLYRSTAQTSAAKCIVGVYGAADTSWGETALTYANRPPTYASNHNPAGATTDNYDYDPNWYTSVRPAVYATDGVTRAFGGRIAISPVNPALLVWEPQYNYAGITMPLQVSKDRGVTWTAARTTANALIPSKIMDRWTPLASVKNLTVDRVNGTFYFTNGSAGGSVSLLSSTDGATWTSLPNFGSGVYTAVYQLVAAPPQSSSATASDLWFAYDGGAYVRRAGSSTWTKITGVASATCISFGKAVTPTGYAVFINGRIGSVRGVYRSDDAYASASPTWTYYGAPTTNITTSLAGDRETFGEVYLGTGGRGMFLYTP